MSSYFPLSSSNIVINNVQTKELNIGTNAGYTDALIPVSDGRINGVNITALNRRTRASYASAVDCVSSWVTRASAADNNWLGVCWAPELSLFVTVAYSGAGNRVMTSSDGITWTTRASTANNDWNFVCWAPELSLFVAVANSGTGNRFMKSLNGITWTEITSIPDNDWREICWASELSLFVAVASTGAGNRVITSPDGVTWTTRTSAADNQWFSVCWAPELSLFVSVSRTGTGNRVMTSPDGIIWTSRTSAADNAWNSVCWAAEMSLFAAVAFSGTGNRIMTSPDGITWTTRTSTANNDWFSVCWAPELSLFTAIAFSGTGNRVMTSPNGITWTTRASSADIQWRSVCWAPELSSFAAVADTGAGNRVMTSAIGMPNSKSVVKALPSQVTVLANGNVGIGTTNPTATLHVADGKFYSPGSVVQCATTQYTAYTSFSIPSSLAPTEISVLNITITPKRANSKIVLQWMISGEVTDPNSIFLVYRDTTPIGFNTTSGNVQWSGVTAMTYDTNENGSLFNISVNWIDLPNTTNPITYSVRIRSSNSSPLTLYLNRAVSSTGQNAYENTCSTGVAWEICV